MGRTFRGSALIVSFLLLFCGFALAAEKATDESLAGSGEGEINVPPDNGSTGEGQISSADEAYEVKLKSLEEKVNQLKEKIFRSKTRLMLLQETLMHGVIAGSR